MKKKILTVFGTRPEAIKLAPLISCLSDNNNFDQVIAVTGQHRQMLDQVLDLFDIVPDIDLGIMSRAQLPGMIIEKSLPGLTAVIKKEKPDLILVHGDTSTSVAAAMAGYYNRIAVGHVEAGLRSGDLDNPFPEEQNRRIVDSLSKFHFVPTEGNKKNLIAEQYSEKNIFVTGNTVIDSLYAVLKKSTYPVSKKIRTLKDIPFILLTAHRRENYGLPLKNICDGIKRIAREYRNIKIVYPVHLNPHIRGPVMAELSSEDNIVLLPPVSYTDMVFLMSNCFFCLTDSGGLQEEVPALGKPVLVLRETTERPEAVRAGTVKVIGTDAVYSRVRNLIEDTVLYRRMSVAKNPYGDGKSSLRISHALEYLYGIRRRRPRKWKS